jgi:hypothetical protein
MLPRANVSKFCVLIVSTLGATSEHAEPREFCTRTKQSTYLHPGTLVVPALAVPLREATW